MPASISWNSFREEIAEKAAWPLHAGASGIFGYFIGHAVNTCDRWLHPVKAALGKPPLVNPWYGAMCGVTFAIVDRLAREILNRYLSKELVDWPFTKSIRKFLMVGTAAAIASNLLPISFTMATTIITVNIIAETLFWGISTLHDRLAYERDALTPQRAGSGR